MEEDKITQLKQKLQDIRNQLKLLRQDELQLVKELEELEALQMQNILQQQVTRKSSQESMVHGKLYQKRLGCATMDGLMYEVNIAALLYSRALTLNKYHHIASNLDAAGTFDDVVMRFEERSVFLQLKHKTTPGKITDQMLVHANSGLLFKHCQSYLKVKNSWREHEDLKVFGNFENAIFVLFTNEEMALQYHGDIFDPTLHELLDTGGFCFRITEEKHPSVYNVFKKLPMYIQVLEEATQMEYPVWSSKLKEVINALYSKDAKSMPEKKELKTMLDNLKSYGDLSHYEQFLSQFYIYSKQANVKKLKELIQHQTIALLGVDSSAQKFVSEVQLWWNNSKRLKLYLTSETPFWKKIVKENAATICKQYPEFQVQFSFSELETMKAMLNNDFQILHLFSECTNLSCLKMQQSSVVELIVDVKSLDAFLNQVLALWRLGSWFDMLVVEVGRSTNINSGVISMLCAVMEKSPEKKVVFVMKNNCDIPEIFLRNLEVVEFHDNFKFNQLDEISQNKILNIEVKFQGHYLPLSKLDTRSAITANLLTNLLRRKKPLQVGRPVDKIDKCYIKRVLVRREEVSDEIFSVERPDHILAVSGKASKKLKKLISNDESIIEVSVFNNTHEPNSRIQFIRGISEFKHLCTTYNNNIHWLHKKGTGFNWKLSQGDISLVRANLKDSETKYDSIEKLKNLLHTVILVVAAPGMGKTTELSRLAMTLKEEDPSIWVIRVNLNEQTPILNQDHPDAMNLLLSAGNLKSEEEKTLFFNEVYSPGRVVVLVDGFDEISPIYSAKVLRIVRELKCTAINIFLTSRLHMRETLEEELCTLGFSFKPFTEEDQKCFLKKFWELPTNGTIPLDEFIAELLKLTATSLNDEMKEFTGIPLQTKMLAEIFEPNAKDFRETGQIKLPTKLDLLYLYQKFIEKKIDIFRKEKNKEDTTKAGVSDNHKKLEAEFHKVHMNCALVSLLDIEDLETLPNSKKIIRANNLFLEEFKQGKIKEGIVVSVMNDKAVFVHRTFAEFFVAKWLSKNYKSASSYIKKTFLSRNHIIRHFFDRILAQGCELHTAVLNHDQALVESLLRERLPVNKLEDGGRIALHLAVLNHLDDSYKHSDVVRQITLLLLEHGADINIKDKVFSLSPLCLSEKCKAWAAIELILEKHDIRQQLNVNSKDIRNHDLRDAVAQGFVHLIRFMLHHGVKSDHLIALGNSKTAHRVTLLHIAAKNNQIELVKLLVEHKANLEIQEVNNIGRTPLILAATEGYYEIVKFLVESAASINAQDRSGRTALMMAAHKGHSDIVKLLIDNGADLTCCDKNTGNSALHSAVKSGCLVSCAKHFRNPKLYINIKNKNQLTPLLLAASKQKWKLAQILVKLGAEIGDTDKDGNTALHHAASSGNNATVSLLLKFGLDVNTKNKKGQTPLWQAAQNGKLETIKLLSANGADSSAADSTGTTPARIIFGYLDGHFALF